MVRKWSRTQNPALLFRMNLITFGDAKSKTGISPTTSGQVEAGKSVSSRDGFGGFCLYRIYYSFCQKSNSRFFWSGKRRIYQYSPLPLARIALVPDFFVDLWLYFWPIQFFLGKGKTDIPTYRRTFSKEKLTRDLRILIYEGVLNLNPFAMFKRIEVP